MISCLRCEAKLALMTTFFGLSWSYRFGGGEDCPTPAQVSTALARENPQEGDTSIRLDAGHRGQAASGGQKAQDRSFWVFWRRGQPLAHGHPGGLGSVERPAREVVDGLGGRDQPIPAEAFQADRVGQAEA